MAKNINIDENVLVRYLAGECSNEELAQVVGWIKASDENARELFRLENVYNKVYGSAMSSREIDKAFSSLQRRIERDEARRAQRHRLTAILRYAAVALLFIVAGTGLWLTAGGNALFDSANYVCVKASVDNPRQVRLSDGTRVWLNTGSTLTYPEEFDGDCRKVKLQGEGYFEVAKNKAKPFVVDGGVVDVTVHGTVFNFRIDGAKQMADVSLLEGSVEVSEHKTNGHMMLQPGQKVFVDCTSGGMTLRNADTRLDAVWHDRLIPFNNANVRQIARTLEQLYNVDITIDPGVDCTHTYSGQIQLKSDIDTVLSLLRNTVPVAYTKNGTKVRFMPQ